MDQKIVAELAELGIIIVDLGDPKRLHEGLAKVLDEEYELDRREHGKNKEWTK